MLCGRFLVFILYKWQPTPVFLPGECPWTEEPGGLQTAQSCPTLCNPMDCSPPGFSVHGILQVRILEWAGSSFSRGSSWSRDRTQVSCNCRQILFCLSHQGNMYMLILTSYLISLPTPSLLPLVTIRLFSKSLWVSLSFVNKLLCIWILQSHSWACVWRKA